MQMYKNISYKPVSYMSWGKKGDGLKRVKIKNVNSKRKKNV